MTVVAITLADGTVGRMQLNTAEEWTDEAIDANIAKTLLPSAVVSWRRVTLADFPVQHSDFRNAWKDDGGKIGVDLARARALTRARLRAERAPLLQNLDVESIKAMEAEDRARLLQIAAEKQRLRDITVLPAIDAARTPEELKAIRV